MSDSNRVVNGKAATPTSYEMESAVLTANNRKTEEGSFEFDISDLVAYFEVIESLNSPGLEFIIAIGDTVNLLERLKLAGNERIQIVVKRNSESRGKEKYEIDCYIAEIFNYVREKPGLQTYSFRCISEHMYHNQLMILKKPFAGTIGDIIERVVKTDLKGKMAEINKTSKDVIKGLFPSMRPVNAIYWLMRNAFDNGTPFFFYESLAKGLHFTSYNKILAKKPFEKYTMKPFMNNEMEIEDGYEEERKQVKAMASDYSVSKFSSAGFGGYASTMHTIDIAEKKFVKTVFNYDNHIKEKLNKNIPFSKSDNAKFLGKTLSEHQNSKNYYVSLNTKSFPKNNNFHFPGGDIDLLKGMAYIENMNFMAHTIDIAGDFNLSVGDVIELEILRAQEDNEGSMVDKMQSGKYVVSQIVHHFRSGYVQSLTIQKDSSEVDLDATR